MFPRSFFEIFGFGVNLYVVLYGLAFVPAVALGLWLARERGYPIKPIAICCLLAITGALAGGPSIVLLLRPVAPRLPLNWAVAQAVGALLLLWAYTLPRPRPIPGPSLEAGDILFPPLVLYGAIARLGCFSAGCCHGTPAWGLPWAVTFPDPASACIFKGIPVHPTQLYESFGCMAIFVVLMALRNRPIWKGNLAWVALLGYGILRFVIEFYRGDVRQMVGPLSLTQLVCMGLITLSCLMLAFRLGRRGTEAPLPFTTERP